MIRPIIFLFALCGLVACKNNGANSSAKAKSSKQTESVETSTLRPIVVDADRAQAAKADYSIKSWTVKHDTLEVVVSYSGGCEEHDFNAYFSGSWLKSLPPQAMVQIEHLNPNNDPCRSIVTDTLLFDCANLEYPGNDEVWVKWVNEPGSMAKYHYGDKKRRRK